ncbi:hypothetical protein KPP03845_102733 [Streptomyces xanthophaeus]|uniref:DUF6907 domain-containing protein n=1 Tax=Streptomyces xanthophaeus TaxID=67385 RepID=UPI00233F0291|nr:hypothetical protein [Streptomyces xanthophaeus]WCD86387.1 hypothetical protein KPP03845_102733 [Streptomyces xanthophaeus]
MTRTSAAALVSATDPTGKVHPLLADLAAVTPAAPRDLCTVTVTGGQYAAGIEVNAELYSGDDPEKPYDVMAVWVSGSDAELDVAGADQLIADLEAALPRLRALRDRLAAIKAGR